MLDVNFNYSEIKSAIQKALSDSFNQKLKKIENPYGNGDSAKKIVDILEKVKIDNNLIQKMISYEV